MIKVEADQIYSEELYLLPKRVLVLIPQPWDSLPQEEVTLLSKILASVRLSLSSVQILTLTEAKIGQLKINNPSHILSFGTQLNPKTKPFSTEIISEVQVIQSETLGNLDDLKKKNLWIALKQAFRL